MPRFRGIAACVLFLAPGLHQLVIAEDLNANLPLPLQQRARDAADRGLVWLSTQQDTDGSFGDFRFGAKQPAVMPTAYVAMAFLSRGHQPGQGRYGRQLSKAIDFMLSAQRRDGSFSTEPEEKPPEGAAHSITGLALSEAYGSTRGAQSARVAEAIRRALVCSRNAQQLEKIHPVYRGGISHGLNVSFVIQTSWELTFMRSAQNAGFEVPQLWIDEGLAFIERCHATSDDSVPTERRLPIMKGQAAFRGTPQVPPDSGISGRLPWDGANFNTTAAGMWAFQLHGRRNDPRVANAAKWIGEFPLPQQGVVPRFYYGCYIWSQVMAQIGGEDWAKHYPRLVEILLPHQDQDGRWKIDTLWNPRSEGEEKMGPHYNTAIAILCLTLSDQLLPIHQR